MIARATVLGADDPGHAFGQGVGLVLGRESAAGLLAHVWSSVVVWLVRSSSRMTCSKQAPQA